MTLTLKSSVLTGFIDRAVSMMSCTVCMESRYERSREAYVAVSRVRQLQCTGMMWNF